ncbi:hypothetical protein Franean1_4134 [Parafrankia sp. EAN1pec]|uniref:hypothetical protein n=1 Tax=Parafrankia sp. (strain EAN1pec) TaxID=298653 RepID=UPI00005416D9|nr:hypothetical protein Franean1_4134 [Frankia sp. EAN1pec]
MWLAAGAVTGLALQNKTLPAFYLFALLIGVLAGGPRDVLRSRWLGAATTIAALAWLPNLLWQATHGWPQLALSRAIAAGASGTSQPRWQFLPMQFLLLGPPLAPVWITGLIRLARSPWRLFSLAYAVLVVLFLATGGKPYYLPIVPVSVLHDTPIAAVNYDAGETVGWPAFTDTVAAVAHAQPAGAVVVTSNYGEAGALLRFRPDVGPVHARQNSLWDQGPPSDTATAGAPTATKPPASTTPSTTNRTGRPHTDAATHAPATWPPWRKISTHNGQRKTEGKEVRPLLATSKI